MHSSLYVVSKCDSTSVTKECLNVRLIWCDKREYKCKVAMVNMIRSLQNVIFDILSFILEVYFFIMTKSLRLLFSNLLFLCNMILSSLLFSNRNLCDRYMTIVEWSG